MHPVFEIGGGTTMLLARKIEGGIGVQLKRLAGQAIE